MKMKKFKRVYIEITNICNLQCSFCPVVERDKSIMTTELFAKVIKEVAPLTEQVCLHLMGEPLAHPEFPRIVELCERENVKINLTTNGILLNRYQDLLTQSSAFHQINFSIHSFKDNFKNKDITPYLLDILNFSKLAFERKPELFLNYRLWNIQQHDMQEDSNLSILETIANFYQIEINNEIDVAKSNMKSKRIWNRVYLHFDSKFIWPALDLPQISTTGFCHGLTSHIGIHADGTVVPCCLDKEACIKLGKVSDSPLTEILTSDRALAMKDGFRHKKLQESLCQRCDYIKRFQ
jgi:radical SAM protein with 4Fe4S-binding SPASM domain